MRDSRLPTTHIADIGVTGSRHEKMQPSLSPPASSLRIHHRCDRCLSVLPPNVPIVIRNRSRKGTRILTRER